jgi:hypothetical protein
VICSHRCELKLNLHLRCPHFGTAEYRGRKLRGNVQHSAGYRVSFGMTGCVLCKTSDVEIVQNAGGVFNMGAKQN